MPLVWMSVIQTFTTMSGQTGATVSVQTGATKQQTGSQQVRQLAEDVRSLEEDLKIARLTEACLEKEQVQLSAGVIALRNDFNRTDSRLNTLMEMLGIPPE